jgi:hypothetical protein
MTKWYWCPSIEKHPKYLDGERRNFGFRVFAFGAVLYLGKRVWTIRIAVPQ